MQKINTNFAELYGTTAEANDLVEDGSPQLGGNLDVNGYTITSASNGNISIVPNGTGTLTLNALKVNGTTISSDDSSKITLAEAVDITGTLTTPTASVTGTLTTPTANVTGTLTTPNLIVNNISSSDSTVVQINDGLKISGDLIVSSITTNFISSDDSTEIVIDDAVFISGTLGVDTINTNIISSPDSSAVQIVDDLNVSGTFSAPSIVSNSITMAIKWNEDSTRTSSIGKAGDRAGMIAWEDDDVYICTGLYDGSTQIWKRAALSTF
jgi:hypothetical protein